MYTVFARKYRPQNFDDVIGQEHCTTTLKNAISKGTIAHAYLFAGPRGVGKTTTARILSKALNCHSGPTPNPCNKCTNCKEIMQGNSLDVLEIDGASNRGIDEVRTLRENARYVPSSSRYKIYIIDEVHMLTKEAFNALLKTLEEPPSHIVFIFATTHPQKLPQTILSRCQRFNFRRISLEDIINTLKYIIEKEDVKIEGKALILIAKKADGALRDAEGMLDQLASYSDAIIKEEDVRNVLGLPGEDVFFDMQSYIINGKTKEILTLIQQLTESGISSEEILTGFIEHLRSVLLVSTNINVGILDEEKEKYTKASSKLTANVILRIMRFLLEAKKEMRYSENPDIYLLEIMARLAAFKIVPIEDIIENLKKIPIKLQKGQDAYKVKESEDSYEISQPLPPLPPQVPVKLKDTHPDKELTNIWQQLASDIETESKALAHTLILGKPIQMDEESITVMFSNEYHRNSIEEKKVLVEKHLSEIVGKKLKIIFKESPVIESKKESAILKKALEIFSAEIISKGG